MQFVDIPRVIETVMEAHKADFAATPSIDDIVNVSSTIQNRARCPQRSWSSHGFFFCPARPGKVGRKLTCLPWCWNAENLVVCRRRRHFIDAGVKSLGTSLQEYRYTKHLRVRACSQVDLWARGKIDEAAEAQRKLIGV